MRRHVWYTPEAADSRREARIRCDIRAGFPGHPVPAHPRRGATARYEDEEDARVYDLVRLLAPSRDAARAQQADRLAAARARVTRPGSLDRFERQLRREMRDLERRVSPPAPLLPRWLWVVVVVVVIAALALWLSGCAAPGGLSGSARAAQRAADPGAGSGLYPWLEAARRAPVPPGCCATDGWITEAAYRWNGERIAVSQGPATVPNDPRMTLGIPHIADDEAVVASNGTYVSASTMRARVEYHATFRDRLARVGGQRLSWLVVGAGLAELGRGEGYVTAVDFCRGLSEASICLYYDPTSGTVEAVWLAVNQ